MCTGAAEKGRRERLAMIACRFGEGGEAVSEDSEEASGPVQSATPGERAASPAKESPVLRAFRDIAQRNPRFKNVEPRGISFVIPGFRQTPK